MKTSETGGAVIRPAQQADLTAVQRLLDAVGLPLDGIEQGFGETWAVAEAENTIAGVAGVEIHVPFGLLRSVAVSPGRRGRGIGNALVRNRVRFARKRGLKKLFLLTTTAAPWFERLSFRRIDRAAVPVPLLSSREFQGVCPAAAVLMELRFGGKAIREAGDSGRAMENT